MQNDEPLEEAVHREIRDETGLKVNYLEQIAHLGPYLTATPAGASFVVAHAGAGEAFRLQDHFRAGNKEARWYPVKELPATRDSTMPKRLRARMDTSCTRLRSEPLAFELLDQKFPVSELEKLYEWVYNTAESTRRNFQKKMLPVGLLAVQQEK